MSFVPLLEFGRRAAVDSFGGTAFAGFLDYRSRTFGLAAAVLAGFWLIVGFDSTTISVGARYFVGLPAAALSAAALMGGLSGPARFPLGFAFVAYAVFGGFVVETSPHLYAWLPTDSGFNVTFGFPVQMLRTVCAVVAAAGIVIAVREAARATLAEAYTSADRVSNLVEGLESEVAERTQSLVESERQLREALEVLQLAKDAGRIGTWQVDLGTGDVTWDATNAILHGLTATGDALEFEDWAATVHPDDLERVSGEYQAALGGLSAFDTEYRVLLEGDAVRHLKGNAIILRDDTGKAVRVVGMNYDLTPLRQKEAELLRTQRIANQAQKMEVVGQLTGGIAHDFNNLLAIIQGNLEILLDSEPDAARADEGRLDMITTALSAARRGGDLTKKMLAFARQSSLEPETLDINAVVKETERWLSRTIPSNIEMEVNLQGRCWPVNVDPTSLQSAIVNVVVNARDAMPDGGMLTMETSNLRVDESQLDDSDETIPPGRYVLLAITDTGQGIPGSEIEKVFDPFFTTKELGVGTGLGLSMVQGFVRQSDGFVRVYSEVGTGTSVKMYFPALDTEASPRMDPMVPADTAPGDASRARILVVDDQVEILSLLHRSLSSAGYTIDVASSGDAALEVYSDAGPYDLLLTDIVMPGSLQGPALARTLRDLQPQLPVIFMSGYASEATVHGNGLRVHDVRLMKPIARAELLRAVEHSLALGADRRR